MASQTDCDNLFETLLSKVHDPYEYNQLIARMLCELINQVGSGGVTIIDGVPVFVDAGRGKTLSYTRPCIRSAAYGLTVTDQYLLMDGVPSMSNQGFILPRKATITGLWAKSRSGNWTFEVRKNGVALTVASLSVVGGSASDENVDIDLELGDVLQLYCNGTNVEYPVVVAELAWRFV